MQRRLSLVAQICGWILVGISVAQEYEDEGENHYFDAFKENRARESLP